MITKLFNIAAVSVFFLTSCAYESKSDGHVTITEDLIKINKDSNGLEKGKRLEALDQVLGDKQIEEVGKNDIDILISMLGEDNDHVRYGAALILSHYGVKAKVAVPQLLKALSKVECSNASLTSESTIRYALKRIRGYDAPYKKCKFS